MTTLLQLNLNIRQGCSKSDEGSPIEARLSNWTTGVPEPLTTRVMTQSVADNSHAPPRRDSSRSTLPRCLQLQSVADTPRKRSAMPSASDSPTTEHLNHQLGSSRAADQFFFSNMLRNLLHRRSRIGHQRHLSEYSITGPHPPTKKRRTVDQTSSKVASEKTSPDSKPIPPRATNIDFGFDSATEKYKIEHDNAAQKYKNERDDVTSKFSRPPTTSSPPATALDLSISGSGGSAIPSTSAPSGLLWWCPSAGISPMIPWPGGPDPSPTSQQHHHPLRAHANEPAQPPVHPWDAAGIMSLLPPDLAAAVQSTSLDSADADHLASHQRLWSKIWRDVPLGELWLRQHLDSPQPPPSYTPPTDREQIPLAKRITKRQGDLLLKNDPDDNCPGRQTNHVKRRRARSHVMHPNRTQQLGDASGSPVATFDSKTTPSCSNGAVSYSKTANFGSSSITSGSSRTTPRSIDPLESVGRRSEKRSSVSVSMARRHIKRESKVAVAGRPRFRTHHSSAFVAPSKPSMVVPPDVSGRNSLSVRESFELATRSKALKTEGGLATATTPTVHYVMANLRSIIGGVHQSEPDLKAAASAPENFENATPIPMAERPEFDGDNGDCSHDDRFQSETQPSSDDQCFYHDNCDKHLQQLLEETITHTTVAPPPSASHLPPDCNMFSALIGLEIVVDYVQRDTSSEAII